MVVVVGGSKKTYPQKYLLISEMKKALVKNDSSLSFPIECKMTYDEDENKYLITIPQLENVCCGEVLDKEEFENYFKRKNIDKELLNKLNFYLIDLDLNGSLNYKMKVGA